MDFLEAVLDPAHEQHRDMVCWYGGPFDTIGFDEERARFCMENMGAPAARPAGQPQERIAASETMTVASRMAGRIDQRFRPQKAPSGAEGTQERS